MSIISKNASNVKLENNRVTYEVMGKLKDVQASALESYIRFNSGEKYSVNPNEARRFMCSLDRNIMILVRIDNYEGIKAQFINEC